MSVIETFILLFPFPLPFIQREVIQKNASLTLSKHAMNGVNHECILLDFKMNIVEGNTMY